MGVQFDRILDGFDGPFQKIDGLAKPPAGKVGPAEGAAGYLLSHQVNDSFAGTTRLLAAGEDVYWLKQELTANGKTYPAGHDIHSRQEHAQLRCWRNWRPK